MAQQPINIGIAPNTNTGDPIRTAFTKVNDNFTELYAFNLGQTAGSTVQGFVNYNATTKTAGQFYGGTAAPDSTTRLNFDGYLYATRLYGDGTGLTSLPAGNLTGTIPSAVLGNSSFNIGTTSTALNRSSGVQSLTGVSIDGNAGTVTNGVYTTGAYADPAWITSLDKTKVGLGNVTNESKATMFTNPTFTGTVSGVTATMVGLGNVENTALSTWAGSANITTIGAATATSLSVTGNLTVNGTTTTVNSTTVTVDDPILTLGGDTAPTTDDNKDRGIEFRWHNGTTGKLGFFGFDDSTGKFTFIPDATNTSEVFSGTKGTIDANLEWADVLSKPNYVASVATTAPLSGGAAGSVGGALTLSLASGYGDTQNPFASKTANTFLAAPNGSAGAPTFRAIVAADIPTLNQNTTGNAGTATTLQTARNINGVSFNGSADITVAAAAGTLTGTTLAAGVTASSLTSVGTLASLAVTGAITGSSFNSITGLSAAVGTTLGTAAVGTSTTVARSDHVHPIQTTVSGNAGTATTLQTARNINGVSFNGSADITVADDTKLPLAGGTLSGALTESSTNDQALTLNKTSGSAWKYIGFSYGGTRRFYFGLNESFEPQLGVDNAATFRVLGNMTVGGSQVLHAGNYNSYSPTLTGGSASGTWGINVTGNAATATTADQIDSVAFRNTGSNAAVNADTLESNGITYYTSGVTNFSGNAADGALYSQAYSAAWQHQIAGDFRSGQIALRGKNSGTWQAWRTVLDSGNYNSYSPTLTGTGASGTWGIRITGFANQGSQRLYSTDSTYNYDSANPYFGYLTYDGSRWLFQVSPGSPAAVRVAYADSAGSATDSTKLPLAGGNMSGGIGRTAHAAGFQVGSYNSVGANETKSNPIYTIGSSYNPTDTAISNMYGIGYSHANFFGTAAGTDWGLYVVNAGSYAAIFTGSGAWVKNTTFSIAGNTALHAANYNSYSPTLTGGSASGTWGINITGNSATVAGLAVHSGRNNVANQIVRTDGSGYIQAGWINTDSGNSGVETRLTRIYSSYDGYLRYSTLADFKVHMGLSAKNTFNRRIDYTSDADYWVGSFGGSGIGANEAFHGGSGFIDIWSGTNFPGSRTHVMGINALHYTVNSFGSTGGNAYGIQVVGQYDQGGELWSRGCSGGTFSAWRLQLDSSNYNSYSPTLTGGNASGTWGINITGNAATITSQANSATISASTGVDGNYIVRRSGEGYIYANHVNFNTSVENPTIANFITDNGDGWSRKSSLAHVKNSIRGVADGTWGISITGNSATASNVASDTNIRVKLLTFTGVGGDSGNGSMADSYGIYQQGGSWTSPYPDLCIGYHTGIKIGAYYGYNGTRFYNNSDWATEIFSVGDSDNNVRVVNNLYVGGNLALHAGNYNSYSPTLTGGNASGTWGISITGNSATATNGRYVYDNGTYSGGAAYREASSMHVYYASLGRTVYNNGAYSGTGWVEPSDLGVRYANSAGSASTCTTAARATRANGNFYIDDNYGNGIVGVYASTRYQGVFAMGDSYKLPADGTTTGSLYGLAWSYPSAGGAAGNLDSHGLLVLINGGFACAISNSIVASGNVTAYSDERLKTNWRPMPESYVSKLAGVKVGIYDRVDNEKITQVGVSAQSMQQILPEAVIVANDDINTLSINYGGAALASAVELAKDNVELRSRIERLEALVEKLLTR